MCSYAWRTRSSRNEPRSCPRCGSRLWRQNFKHECCKCGHIWRTSRESAKKCPACQSAEWDLTRKAYSPVVIPQSVKDEILAEYDSGTGAVQVAIDLDITFSDVFDVVRAAHPGTDVVL